MRYWVELDQDHWIYVEACIWDSETPCDANPEHCCLARARSCERAELAPADEEEPF